MLGRYIAKMMFNNEKEGERREIMREREREIINM